MEIPVSGRGSQQTDRSGRTSKGIMAAALARPWWIICSCTHLKGDSDETYKRQDHDAGNIAVLGEKAGQAGEVDPYFAGIGQYRLFSHGSFNACVFCAGGESGNQQRVYVFTDFFAVDLQ